MIAGELGQNKIVKFNNGTVIFEKLQDFSLEK